MKVEQFNLLDKEEARDELTRCCGSRSWVDEMMRRRPFQDKDALFAQSDEIWNGLTPKDWLEAFSHHPKIGDLESLRTKFGRAEAALAQGEQASVATATDTVLHRLADGNQAYEKKFGYIFIVCATGKSAEEMLALLESRIHEDPAKEIQTASQEQAKITRIRLTKLLT